jgi:hypothetical protein
MGIAEVSLIVSGVAAVGSVGAAIATYRLGVRRFAEDRRLTDLSDARSVLTAAAVELHRSTEALNLLRGRIESAPMVRDEDPDDADELIEAAAERGKELETRLASVRVRFKTSDAVARSLYLAVEAMLGLVTAYRRRHSGRKDDDSLQKREGKVTDLRHQFDTAAATFYEAAQYAVGSEV